MTFVVNVIIVSLVSRLTHVMVHLTTYSVQNILFSYPLDFSKSFKITKHTKIGLESKNNEFEKFRIVAKIKPFHQVPNI